MSPKNKIITILVCLLIPVSGYPGSNKNHRIGSKKRPKSFCLSGHYKDDVKHGDSVTVSLWKDPFTTNNSQYIPHRTFKTAIRNGNFQIRIDSVVDVSYLSLSGFNDKFGNP